MQTTVLLKDHLKKVEQPPPVKSPNAGKQVVAKQPPPQVISAQQHVFHTAINTPLPVITPASANGIALKRGLVVDFEKT